MSPWSGFTPSECFPDKCQCELARDAWIRQPSSFWSSLAYIVAGLLIHKTTQLKNRELRLWTFVCLLMGASSLFGHASFVKFSLAVDFASIVLVLSFFALFERLKKFSSLKISSILSLYYVVLFFSMYSLEKWPKIGSTLVIFAFTLREIGSRLGEKELQLALAILVLSFGFFLIDEFHVGCDPTSFFQWHSLWHLGSAYSMFLYGKWRLSVSKSVEPV
jgi:hypothetical protein